MILLSNDLAIDADKRQFILKEKRVIKEGERKGEIYWKDIGYYPTLLQLTGAVFDRNLMSACSELQTLQEVRESLTRWAGELQSPLLGDLKEAVRKMNAHPASNDVESL